MTSPRVWWIHPAKLTLGFVVPIYLLIVYLVPVAWPQILVLKGTPTYIEGTYAINALVMLALLGFSALLGSRFAFRRRAPERCEIGPLKLGAVGAVTIAAYVIWFFPILLRGSVSLERSELNQTPGITSFTQMGVPFVVCYLVCSRSSGQTFPRWVRIELWSILLLTVARVFIWSERLAAIEVLVPAVIVMLTFGDPRRGAMRGIRKVIEAGGPYLAIPALLTAFTFTEYFRSWRTYSQTQSLPLIDFMTSRVVSYYFTALNNGAGMLATRTDEWPSYDFFFTANWLYHLPGGIGAALYTAFVGHGDPPNVVFLDNFADPEFNNMSGIFPIMYDLGTAGTALYFCLFGLASGMLYRSMVAGSKSGAMFYPAFFVACLEVMRTAYLSGARIILLFVGAVFLWSQMRNRAVLLAIELDGPGYDGAVLWK
jgi:oligosaccharide repeat unit polymerase